MTRFSVLVPVYNVEEYLPECLVSVLGQTFSDFEVVLVDDGSTDRSGALCDEAACRDDRVRVIHQRNRGLLLARRVAIDTARGEYLVCVDSDDALRLDALEVVDAALRRTDADLLCFQASRKRDFSVPFLDFGELAGTHCTTSDEGMARARRVFTSTHMLNQMWCKAFRHCTTDVGADYTAYEGLQYGEDLFQTCVLFDRARSVAFIDDVLYFYRQNMGSISHAVSPTRLENVKIVRGRLAAYAERWNPNLVPLVHANDCVEVLAYAIKLVLSGAGTDADLRRLSVDPFVVGAQKDADFSQVSRWKVPLIRLLARGDTRGFRVAVRLLFALLRTLAPQKAVHYL